MNSIFEGCISLTSLDIRDFNTENLGLMGSMFKDCRSFVRLDVSRLNTGKCMDFATICENCRKFRFIQFWFKKCFWYGVYV